MTIPNQANVVKNIKQLFVERRPAQRSPLTPTQRFVVASLRSHILMKDNPAGKKDAVKHWELRKLKETRTILLVSIVDRTERYILIGPRGMVQALDGKGKLDESALDEAIQDEVVMGLS